VQSSSAPAVLQTLPLGLRHSRPRQPPRNPPTYVKQHVKILKAASKRRQPDTLSPIFSRSLLPACDPPKPPISLNQKQSPASKPRRAPPTGVLPNRRMKPPHYPLRRAEPDITSNAFTPLSSSHRKPEARARGPRVERLVEEASCSATQKATVRETKKTE
jgi:hypothetical protein